MELWVQAIVTIFSLINPVICVAMFQNAVAGATDQEVRRAATRAALSIATILAGAALVGARILRVFGISLDAFQVAGGAVLVAMGGNMLLRGAAPGSDEDAPEGKRERLARLILFAASPGTITGVITLSISHSAFGVPAPALVAVAVVVGITWGLMLGAARVKSVRTGKPSMLRDLNTRYMGLLVLSMGVQFALQGAKGFFTGP